MKILLILFATIILSADAKKELLNLYENQNFQEACAVGLKNFSDNSKDEEYITLYAFSCLNIDFIDRLSVPIALLKYSEEARANAAYFSTILLQKKLLYYAMVDEHDISNLIFPKTDYVLSKVFDLYVKLKKDEKQEFYIFDDEDDSALKYKLYILKNDRIDKIVIEVLYNSVIIKKHIYW